MRPRTSCSIFTALSRAFAPFALIIPVTLIIHRLLDKFHIVKDLG
jgi:hypothetical protein